MVHLFVSTLLLRPERICFFVYLSSVVSHSLFPCLMLWEISPSCTIHVNPHVAHFVFACIQESQISRQRRTVVPSVPQNAEREARSLFAKEVLQLFCIILSYISLITVCSVMNTSKNDQQNRLFLDDFTPACMILTLTCALGAHKETGVLTVQS